MAGAGTNMNRFQNNAAGKDDEEFGRENVVQSNITWRTQFKRSEKAETI